MYPSVGEGSTATVFALQVDWVLVRVNTIRRVVAVAVTGVLATVLVFVAYAQLNLPPEGRARRAIARAEDARSRAVSTTTPPTWRDELRQAEGLLDAAREAFGDEEWESSEGLADEARGHFEALTGAESREVAGVGQFFSVDGRVQVQRAGRAEWSAADERLPVFNGDFVRSGRDGSAEILFNDGTLYRISPSSLLEIHYRPEREQSSTGSVKMVVGRLNVSTSGASSKVTTDTTEAEIRQDSRVSVDVDTERRQTTVATYQGVATVRNPEGDEVTVSDREQISAAEDGRFGSKRSIPDPPTPLEPEQSRAFDLATEPVILLRWTRPDELPIHLQVSRSPRFVESMMDVDAVGLSRDSVRLQAIDRGTYFWRLASIGRGNARSEWGPVRRFRIFAPGSRPVIEDSTPPDLSVAPPQQLGYMFIVEGSTEPGATVTVNGESVELEGDGRFRKMVELHEQGWNHLVVVAVDPSGNRAEHRERVYVEVF